LAVQQKVWILLVFSGFYAGVLAFLGFEQLLHIFFGDMEFLQFQIQDFPRIAGIPSSRSARAQAWRLRFFVALLPFSITSLSFVMLSRTFQGRGFYDIDFWNQSLFTMLLVSFLAMLAQATGATRKLVPLLVCCSVAFLLAFAGNISNTNTDQEDEYLCSKYSLCPPKAWSHLFIVPFDLFIFSLTTVHLHCNVLWEFEKKKLVLWAQRCDFEDAQAWAIHASLRNAQTWAHSIYLEFHHSLSSSWNQVSLNMCLSLRKKSAGIGVGPPSLPLPSPQEKEPPAMGPAVRTVASEFYQHVVQVAVSSLEATPREDGENVVAFKSDMSVG
jgi:hypothetical protein